MTGGENKSVAVDPAGIGWINLKCLTKENSANISRPEGKTEVSRLAGGDGINGESTGIPGGELKKCVVHKINFPEQTSGPAFASLDHSHFRHADEI